jgi:hypothetical protein
MTVCTCVCIRMRVEGRVKVRGREIMQEGLNKCALVLDSLVCHLPVSSPRLGAA